MTSRKHSGCRSHVEEEFSQLVGACFSLAMLVSSKEALVVVYGADVPGSLFEACQSEM